MKRKYLKEYLLKLVKDYQNKTYDDWKNTTFPIVFETTFMGKFIQGEIDILESEKDYLRIMFSVFTGGLSAYFPVSTTIIVKKVETFNSS